MALELPYPGQPGGPSATPVSDIFNPLRQDALMRRQMELMNQYYGPKAESQIALQNSQRQRADFLNKNPLLNMPGVAGQVGAMQYLKNQQQSNQGQQGDNRFNQENLQGSDNNNIFDPVAAIRRNLQANLNKNVASTQLTQAKAKGYTWNQLPVDTRNNMTAQFLGMGIDPVKGMKYVNEGYDLKQIADKEGLDPENLPPPIYYPTTTTKTRTQQVQQVGAELDYLSSATTPLIKQYADTFMGFSPDKLKDMMSKDPDSQKRYGQYIGALSVQSGLANGRVLLEGGKPGVEVMRMVKNSALQGIDEHSPIKMSKIAYEEAQKTIDKILQRGAKIRTMTGMSPFSRQNESVESGNEKVDFIFNPKTGKLEAVR